MYGFKSLVLLCLGIVATVFAITIYFNSADEPMVFVAVDDELSAYIENSSDNIQQELPLSIVPYCDKAIVTLQEYLLTIPNLIKDKDPLHTLRIVDDWLLALDNVSGVAGLYEYVHPDSIQRRASTECSQKINALLNDFLLSTEIYGLLKDLDVENQNSETQRFYGFILRELKRSGVTLDITKRQRIHELRATILRLGQEFSANIRSEKLNLTVSSDDLIGLPDDYIKTRPITAEGLSVISTDYPDYVPLMQYAEKDSVRLRMMRLFLSRAQKSNASVLMQLLSSRDELAKLLGYENYATYDLQYKMAKNPQRVQAFINDINEQAIIRSEEDYAILLNKLKTINPEAIKVAAWQKSYLSNLIKQEKYAMDAKEVRSYFRYKRVKQGVFSLVEDLFDIEIRSSTNASTWHDSVEFYEVYEKNNLIGQFFLDMHPRPFKYSHAAHFGIRTGVTNRQYPTAVLVCNFPEDKNHPDGALMEHTQTETFLHEFGHLMHSILSGHQNWSLLSGIATEHDFVEAPSQMLEEWVWNTQTLQQIAKNDNGEVIPDALIEKMRKSRFFGRGLWVRNQLFYASLALTYHMTPPEDLDLFQDMIALQEKYAPFEYIEGTTFFTSFGHLYGYAASYYSYMWSLVIATDMLAEFERYGMRNKNVARVYRRHVLDLGGTKDAAVMVRNFLGRDYNDQAFIERLNRKQQ